MEQLQGHDRRGSVDLATAFPSYLSETYVQHGFKAALMNIFSTLGGTPKPDLTKLF